MKRRINRINLNQSKLTEFISDILMITVSRNQNQLDLTE